MLLISRGIEYAIYGIQDHQMTVQHNAYNYRSKSTIDVGMVILGIRSYSHS